LVDGQVGMPLREQMRQSHAQTAERGSECIGRHRSRSCLDDEERLPNSVGSRSLLQAKASTAVRRRLRPEFRPKGQRTRTVLVRSLSWQSRSDRVLAAGTQPQAEIASKKDEAVHPVIAMQGGPPAFRTSRTDPRGSGQWASS